MPKPVTVSSEADLLATCGSHTGLTTVLIWADWHEPSVHMKKVLEAMSAQHPKVQFATVNVDVCWSLALKLGADQVPYTVFLTSSGDRLDAFGGPHPPTLVEKVKLFGAKPRVDYGNVGRGLELNRRLDKLINFSNVMLFMKGNKEEPFCKFSKQAIAIMNEYDTDYSTFDILQDDEVRQGLKDYKEWKTYPQLYVNGDLIGGVDIIKEMHDDGSLAETFPKSSSAQNRRLKALIDQAPVMVFMKGNPAEPRCGFSRKLCEKLKEESIEFSTFDILSDEDVRQDLKAYANWSTYPQVYSNGKLMGGLDIINELVEDGSFKRELGLVP